MTASPRFRKVLFEGCEKIRLRAGFGVFPTGWISYDRDGAGQTDDAPKSGNPGKLRRYPEMMPSSLSLTLKASIWAASRMTKIVGQVVALLLGYAGFGVAKSPRHTLRRRVVQGAASD